jgi:topoisomerase IA-like protein
LALFTNKRLKKVIFWEENIDKIINSLNFDVVEVIEKMEVEENKWSTKKRTTKKTTTKKTTARKTTTKKAVSKKTTK